MGRVVYSAITSLDGYVADAQGSFTWAKPDELTHRAINELEAAVGTVVYGRRMYEVMRYWADAPEPGETSEAAREFAAMWQATDKLVVSRTLPDAPTPNTTLLRELSPAAMVQLARTSDRDLSIGGPTIAAAALRAGAVDDLHAIVVPHVVGGGLPWLPPDLTMDLELVAVRELGSGAVHLHYRLI
jgi:dihydrofolate reductase